MPNWTVERMMREYPDFNVSDLGDWRCQIQGTREQWWMDIVDERMPGHDKPYRISLYENEKYLIIWPQKPYVRAGLLQRKLVTV